MKKLTNIDLTTLNHIEFGQFIVRFFEDFKNSSLDTNKDTDFKKMFNTIHAQIPTYNSSLDQIRASTESAKIADADAVRDADFQALRDSVKPYRNAKTQTEKEAYITINILLDQYKNVQHASYEEETKKLNTLVENLLSSDYSFAVSALNIVKFTNHLSDSNSTFNKIFSFRSLENSQKQNFDAKALRKALTQDYKQMANYIVTLANVKEGHFYKDLLNVLNNGRAHFSKTFLTKSNGKKTEKQF